MTDHHRHFVVATKHNFRFRRHPRRGWLGGRLASFVAVIVAVASASGWLLPVTGNAATSLKIWVLPQSGTGFLYQAVLGARHSIDMSMYELSDAQMENDLVARAKAGVSVHVVLDAAYEGRDENAAAAAVLKHGGVKVTFAPSSQIFHAKYLVIDAKTLLLGTGNLQTIYYSSTRDFWVQDSAPADVAAAQATFNADFDHAVAPLAAGNDLVWSPGSTSALLGVIDGARHSLLVENEEMSSSTIEFALTAAAQRGVDVQVVMTTSSEWYSAWKLLRNGGVHVSVVPASGFYIHAKVICADCATRNERVFVGSENFSTSSLDYNRELGVVTTNPLIATTVRTTVLHDYATGSTSAG